MVARVTSIDLRILIHSEKEDEDLEASFINTANIFVDAHLLNAGHSAAVLAQIELHLAAHFLALSEEYGGLIRDSVGESSQSVANVYGPGLASTRFGQTALLLDTSGILQQLSTQKNRAQFRVVSEVWDGQGSS